jgi:hypothetical protein
MRWGTDRSHRLCEVLVKGVGGGVRGDHLLEEFVFQVFEQRRLDIEQVGVDIGLGVQENLAVGLPDGSPRSRAARRRAATNRSSESMA